MNTLLRYSRLTAAFVALLFTAAVAPAQTTNGQIAGNVLDASGAAIPNAAITAKGEETGTVFNAVSTSAGSYRFPSVPLGHYTVTTTARGFKAAVNIGVEVRVGTVTSLDISVSAGGANETVTVESSGNTVETQSSEVSGTVTTQQIIDLPLALGGVGATRSPEAFVFLIPGTTGPGSANNGNGIFLNKLGGGQNFGNEILLDGASVIRTENGSSFDEASPSVEAISEFKVTTSTPAAEFGRTTGGIENFVTKSGTNSYHGTAFDIFRNDALDANTWFNNGNKAFRQQSSDPNLLAHEGDFNRPNDKKNDYGGSLGGAVIIPHLYNGRDKTFFFFSWEQFLQNLGGTAVSSVPTVAERTGNFQDRLINGATGQINPCDGNPIFNGEIFDPSTTRTVNGTRCRLPFGTSPTSATGPFPANFNVIPQGRFSKVGQNIAALYPAPNSPSLNNNYSLNSSSPIHNTLTTIRIDEAINEKNKIFASYSPRENTRNNPTNRAFLGPQDYATQVQDFITHYGRAGWDLVLTPNLLNHLNIGTNRTNSINTSFNTTSTLDAAALGITNTVSGLPGFGIGGYSPLGRNQNDDNIDNGIRFNDSVSWQRGRNGFKFGFDYRYQQYSSISKGGLNGSFGFGGGATVATQTGTFNQGTGNGFADLLLGQVSGAGITIPFHQAQWIQDYYAGFAQDDLKVNNALVLNLGVRYEVDRPRKEKYNDTSNFSTTTIDPHTGLPGALIFATNCTNCNKRWADTWFKDVAPRVGFAYTPPNSSGKTVLRGGFATLYAPLQYSDFGGDTRQGFTQTPQFSGNGFDPAFTIDTGFPAYKAGINTDPGQFDNGNADSPQSFGNFVKSTYGRPGQLNQWNLQVQQELAKDLVMTIGYIGNSGAHLKSQEENINNIDKSNFIRGDGLVSHDLAANGVKAPYAAYDPLNGGPTRMFNGQVQQALRPFPQYGFIASDCCLQNVGHSTYHALIASIERRFSDGLNFQASYTWSKTITNADSIINVTNGVSQEQDPSNSKSQKSLSNQDIPHTFVVSYLYQLPFGKGKRFLGNGNPILRAAISGIEIGAVQRYQSGEPFSFGCASGIPGFDNCISFTRIPGTQLSSNARLRGKINPFRNLEAGGNVGGPDPNVDSIFNGELFPTNPRNGTQDNPNYQALQNAPAFIDQNNGDYRLQRARVTTGPAADNGGFLLGNVPRVTGEVRNFKYYNEDFSINKKTPIGDNLTATFKIELLNAFNRHIFATPSTNPGDNFYGVPTYTIDSPRAIQLTARIQF